MTEAQIQQALAAEEVLATTLSAYTGQWVAIRDHRVVKHADTLNALLERVEPEMATLERIFEVGEPGGICFL
jgi:Family of unknown function (DUF5678)